jgi:hypothetical protein
MHATHIHSTKQQANYDTQTVLQTIKTLQDSSYKKFQKQQCNTSQHYVDSHYKQSQYELELHVTD